MLVHLTFQNRIALSVKLGNVYLKVKHDEYIQIVHKK